MRCDCYSFLPYNNKKIPVVPVLGTAGGGGKARFAIRIPLRDNCLRSYAGRKVLLT
jgi:hypothetical protein